MFETHKLNENGFRQVKELKKRMASAVNDVMLMMPDGREKAVFKTKIEEAMFFGTKSIAGNENNHTEVINYGD